MICAADRRFCCWTMRLSSMRLSLKKGSREYKKSSTKLARWMRFSKILLCWSMSKELWLVTHLTLLSRVRYSLSDSGCWLSFQFLFSDDIGSNIDGAQAATAQAKSQLAKASKTQRSNSSLVILNSLILFLKKHNFTTGGTF